LEFLKTSNICCPVCCDIYRDPVLLSCSHSLCKACWQRCKTVKSNPECPICRRSCSSDDPPQNLALRNVCEAFSQGSGERLSAAPSELCSLHAEKLQLFCVQDQQPVCLICQFSRWHTNHSFRPIEEAAAEHRSLLLELLRPLQEKQEFLTDAEENLKQAVLNTELQFTDTERQIKDVFSTLRTFLQKDEEISLSLLISPHYYLWLSF
uniref:RING-type domain-containing protein n=1 Tax=Kryptolebias marmoratus TaxID=37003 RepID=A0A3Q3F4L1_KRYMA